MVKKCSIVMNNGVNMVVLYDGRKIQMPSIKTDGDSVFVKYSNGRYSITSSEEYEGQKVALKQKTKTAVSKSPEM